MLTIYSNNGNVFELNEEFWIQLLGTDMETERSPNICEHFYESLRDQNVDELPHLSKGNAWTQFIDDVLFLFLGSYEQLEELHTYLNSCHPTMKFDKPEYNKVDNSTNFLDMKIRIVENQIVTDLYTKKISKLSFLNLLIFFQNPHFNFFHLCPLEQICRF